jgi:pimeloyl-ACP methyl ester carboxylesterase
MTRLFTLNNGELCFTAVEEGQGPLVLCFHGFPDCYQSFRYQLPFLAEQGYRAVSVSLRGYEPSSQPVEGNYSLESTANDVTIGAPLLSTLQVLQHQNDFTALPRWPYRTRVAS